MTKIEIVIIFKNEHFLLNESICTICSLCITVYTVYKYMVVSVKLFRPPLACISCNKIIFYYIVGGLHTIKCKDAKSSWWRQYTNNNLWYRSIPYSIWNYKQPLDTYLDQRIASAKRLYLWTQSRMSKNYYPTSAYSVKEVYTYKCTARLHL